MLQRKSPIVALSSLIAPTRAPAIGYSLTTAADGGRRQRGRRAVWFGHWFTC